MRRGGGAVVALFLVSCGAGGDTGDIDDGDAGMPDAGRCAVAVDFTPEQPVSGLGATVVARSTLMGSAGLIDYQWTVSRGGVPVAITPLASDERDVEFPVEVAGIYDVHLGVGGDCQGFYGALNVRAPGARTTVVRLRFVPPAGVALPLQEQIIAVTGGADQTINVVALDPGQVFELSVRDHTSAPVAAYLRFLSRSAPDVAVEGFSDDAGVASVRLVAGRYDVLVVPASGGLAPQYVVDFDPFVDAITVDAGEELTGVVRDGAGAPLAGARVSVASGSIPSTVATTAADGSYRLRWRDDPVSAETWTVVPPERSGWPRIDASVELNERATIDATLAPLGARDLVATIVRVDGEPAASTDVVFDAVIADAATLTADGVPLATVSGRFRRAVRTNGAGGLPSIVVPGVPAMVFAASGTGAAGLTDLSLASSLGLSTTTATGRVLGSDGQPVAGARLRASLVDDLAFTGAPSADAVAGDDGTFSLSLAAGVGYQLVVVDPALDDASLRREFSTDLAALGDLVLGPALAVSGQVRKTGQPGGLRGVGVEALCYSGCAGLDRSRPFGSAVTDASGGFVIAVPDPGTEP